MSLSFKIGDCVRHKTKRTSGTIYALASFDEVYVQWEGVPVRRARPTQTKFLVLEDNDTEDKIPWWIKRIYDKSNQQQVAKHLVTSKYDDSYKEQLEARYLLQSRNLWFHQLWSLTSKWSVTYSSKYDTDQYVLLECTAV